MFLGRVLDSSLQLRYVRLILVNMSFQLKSLFMFTFKSIYQLF